MWRVVNKCALLSLIWLFFIFATGLGVNITHVYAISSGTGDGTYDFGGVLGSTDSNGAGFRKLGDKWGVSNAIDVSGTQLYSTNSVLGGSATTVIKAEGGTVNRQFTFKDLGISSYNSSRTLEVFDVVLKDSSGAQIGSVKSLTSSPYLLTTAITQISTLLNSGVPFNIDNVASITITSKYSTSAQTDLNFENITVSNIGVNDTIAPVLSATSSSAITHTTATLNFTSDEAGTYYYMVYAAGDAAPNAVTVAAQGSAVAKGTASAVAAMNTAIATGLTALTDYKAYVIVKDAAGNTSAVQAIPFTTSAVPDVTAPVLSASSASAITHTTATLNFTSDEAGTYYYLVYAAGDVAPNAVTVAAQGSAVAKGTASAVAAMNTAIATGLTALTDYKAYVIVKDAAGNTSAVQAIPFTTSAVPDVTAPVLSASSASAITHTTATLNFTSDEAGTYYYLVYAAGDVAPNAVTVAAQGSAVAKGTASAVAAANTANATGLTALTDYKAYVMVKDAAGNTSTVQAIPFTTSAAPDITAPVLSAASSSAITHTTAMLNFTSDEAGIYYYLVYAAEDAAPNAVTVAAQGSAAAKGTASAVAAANTANATGLTALTDYKAYVMVKDAAGNTSAVQAIPFTTSAAPDITAPVLSAASSSAITHTTAMLNFTSDEAGIYYYLVYAAEDAAPNAVTVAAQGSAAAKGTASAVAAANTANATGLTALTDYKAYVMVKDAAGNTSAVQAIPFTTSAAPDITAPVLSAASSSAITHTAATLNFTSDEAGTYYYMVYAAGDAAPNAFTVAAQGTAVAKGTASAVAAANTANATGLTALTDYKAYAIVKDAAGNTSTVQAIPFTTSAAPDVTAPVASVTSAVIPNTTDVTTAQSTEAGTLYLVLDGANITTVSAAEDAVMRGIAKKTSGVSANTATSISTVGLVNGTYRVISADAAGNISAKSTNTITIVTSIVLPPTDVIAIAGNEQATIIFNLPVGDGASTITAYEVTSSPGNITVMGTSSPITVMGLSNGTAYTFTVKAINNTGGSAVSAVSNTVTPRSTSTTTTTTTNNSSTPTPAGNSTIGQVLVNGKLENFSTEITTKVKEQTVTTVSIDSKKLEDELGAESQAVITIMINNNSDVAIAELDGQLVKNMEQKQAVFEIKTLDATYTLPAKQINITAILEQLGKGAQLQDIKIQIEISKPNTDTMAAVNTMAAKEKVTVVASPLNFGVKAIFGETTIDVSKFNAYVERKMVIPDNVDPGKITTAVVLDPDGTVRHVPTKVIKIDGKYFVEVNSLTNSTYVIIWHPLEFEDVAQHWAKDVVNDMGSRMVISGSGVDRFDPNQEITRAEFAAILVRGLGLKLANSSSSFADVKSVDWYSGAIQTAYEYNLISGFEDGTFRPMDKITREQAMTIVAKAMGITGIGVSLQTKEAEELLSPFVDASIASEWAKNSIADCLQAGIVAGRNNTHLAPKAHILKAEAATIVQRLLQESELI
ncbi:S-layer homology domain-containing protein [Paenibacillus monticola]|nr:S-layer homology domain-containing protein [Paenibacillus monticola]